jgi:lipopolysaccharide/colanic/teichoic acid biosynthesis glycosyltransferase
LFPIIAIIIKLNSKGPVFFKQKRTGLGNEDFWCWKFRTMHVNQNADVVQATKKDARITSTGGFFRRHSIDELPQFFNVLLGNMSVVGPRPHMLKHTEEYSEIIDKYMVRHFIKPGITGLAQVKGYRGETITPDMMERRIKLDIFYMENWSFLLDIKIIFLTVWNILREEENAG